MANDDDRNRRDEALAIDLSAQAWRTVSPEAEQRGVPRGLSVGMSPELARVLALPRRAPVEENTPTADALIHLGMLKYARVRDPAEDMVAMDAHLQGDYERARDIWKCECRKIDPARYVSRADRPPQPCIASLLWIQAWALYEIEQNGGLIGAITVGAGKTALDIMAALALRNCSISLLLIPPSLVDQIEIDYRLIAEHFRVPGIVVHAKPAGGRRPLRVDPQRAPGGSMEPMLHVLPYSRLSNTESSAWIERLHPGAIIADEVDALKSLESARSMRVARYIAEHWRTTRFCGWTGSLTDSSISEFSHLAAWALRGGSPMPLERSVVDEWGRALDANPSPSPAGALERFLAPGEATSMRNIRRAFRRRLAETSGFVMTGGRQVITTSAGKVVDLDVSVREAPPIPDIIEKALAIVRRGFRPDTLVGGKRDDIFEDPMQQVKCARDVATGIMHRWIFPKGEADELIEEWFEARSLFFSELRKFVLGGRLHLDSPKLCIDAARRYYGEIPLDPERPNWESEHWPRWRDISPLVEPEAKAERLHSFLVDDVAAWAVANKGIVWYGIREFAAWVRERARELYDVDLPVFGAGSADALMDEVRRRGDRSIICSLEAHGRGRDRLQFAYSTQLVAQLPSSDRRWTQLLARLHRRGQQADDVTTLLYQHTDEVCDALDQALMRGEYVEGITDESRKLIEGWRG